MWTTGTHPSGRTASHCRGRAHARQDRYVRNLGKSAEYTPQFIVDGRTELLGARAQLSEQALAEPKPGVGLSLAEQNAGLRIEVRAAPGRSAASEVILVSYLAHASSAVAGGDDGKPVVSGLQRRAFPARAGKLARGGGAL